MAAKCVAMVLLVVGFLCAGLSPVAGPLAPTPWATVAPPPPPSPLPLVESRTGAPALSGRVCADGNRTVALLIDPSIADGIRAGLSQFETDLCADGHAVYEHVAGLAPLLSCVLFWRGCAPYRSPV